MERVVIVAAKRTAIGRFGGQFKEMSAIELGQACLTALLQTVPQAQAQVEQVLLGNVLSAGLGQNPARQVAIKSGLKKQVVATTINDVCGSSLKALRFAQMSLLLGDSQVVVAGGIENMSQAPLLLPRPGKQKSVDRQAELTDSLFHDGLTDALTDTVMGKQVEQLAQQAQVSRLDQDQFALVSQQKAQRAQSQGQFAAEIAPVKVKGQVVTRDEAPRPQTSLAKLAALPPAFSQHGTITAGNASPLNDGASMVLLTTATHAQKMGWPILAQLNEFSEVGVASPEFGLAPIPAIQKLLSQMTITSDQIDLFEINESFAAQALLIQQELAIPTPKLNVYGGAIALGHPLGASGTRLLTTLLTAMQQKQATHAIISMCIGGGQGIAWHLSR